MGARSGLPAPAGQGRARTNRQKVAVEICPNPCRLVPWKWNRPGGSNMQIPRIRQMPADPTICGNRTSGNRTSGTWRLALVISLGLWAVILAGVARLLSA
jgi:hypothetical protein